MVMGVCDPTVTERGGPGRFGAWVKTGMLRHAMWEVKGNALPSVGFAACLLAGFSYTSGSFARLWRSK